MTSQEFRQYRINLRKTQNQLAELLGINRRTVQRYENDELSIPQKIVDAIKTINKS